MGQLYLNKGLWNGERIFSEQWAEDSLKPKGKFWPKKTIKYSHNWWCPFLIIDHRSTQARIDLATPKPNVNMMQC
ncbi:hypothetical protein C9J12_10055 [Photobacterium frigidiphilum]|uniref:Uncharacterized protein n=1 Tax=Photobacterium frigidiphilum TaxID=264736 RepID=A0A2T3JIY2_9GAMM|nr:hypothetical protein C9J12_10055 [Photobacterium frigidiphilum]